MHVYESKFIKLYEMQDSTLPALQKLLRIDSKSCEDCRVNISFEYVPTRWFVVLSVLLTYYYFKLVDDIQSFPYLRDIVKLQALLLIKEDNIELREPVLRYIELRTQLIQYLYKNEVLSNRSR